MQVKPICLQGPRVTIRLLTRQDLDDPLAWLPSRDPLYQLFDWPPRSAEQNDLWFSQLMRDGRRVYYAVENEQRCLIGRISLREILWQCSARLGIGFGARFVGQGYGSESLRVFLRYYFLDLGFERMFLDVAAANERAIRCYQRCGFKMDGSHYADLESDDDLSFLRSPAYRRLAPFFIISRRRKQMLSYDMVLEKRDWLAEMTFNQPFDAPSVEYPQPDRPALASR